MTLNTAFKIVMAALFLYSVFMAGRCFEAYKYAEDRKVEEIQVIKKRMKFHGTQVAMCQRGVCYFVRDVKDIENRKKWIRL